jgi:hypothetical protein
MRTDERHDPHRRGSEINTADIRNPETVHEERDINVRGILMFGVWLFVAAVIIHIVLWGFFRFMENRAATADPQPSPVAEQRSNKFPEPQLQPNPVGDLSRLKAGEAEQLNRYGWMNRQAGVAHVPIDRAMELVVQRGLPSRPAQPQSQIGNPESSGGEGPNRPASTSPSSQGQAQPERKPVSPAKKQKPRQQ